MTTKPATTDDIPVETEAATTTFTLTKLTIKGCRANPKLVTTESGPVNLIDVYGVAKSTVTKEVNGQFFTAINGSFEAVNCATGDVFKSGILYLPGGMHESLAAAIEETKNPVEFGIRIRAVAASNPIGYSYEAMSLLPPAKNDELSTLRARMAAHAEARALAAPKPTLALAHKK